MLYSQGEGGRGALCHLFHPAPNLWAALWLTQTKAADTDFPGPVVLDSSSLRLTSCSPPMSGKVAEGRDKYIYPAEAGDCLVTRSEH